MANKGSYNITRLISFIETNNITLLGEYNKTTRDTIVSGICKRDGCSNCFKKNLRTLIVNNSK
jgi:hypothetical protein